MNMVLHSFASSLSYTTTTTTTSNSFGNFIFDSGLFWVFLALLVLVIAATWRVYQKAARHGWAAIVPVYSQWTMFEIVGLPGWLSLLSIVPFVQIITYIMQIVAYFRLPKLFGKGTGFCIANVFFGFITMPILGFGSAQFQGDDSAGGPTIPEAPYPTVMPPTPPTPPTPSDGATPPTSPTPPPSGPVIG